MPQQGASPDVTPAPLERTRCAIARSVYRLLILAARATTLLLLPRDHPSRIFTESAARSNKLMLARITQATVPRTRPTEENSRHPISLLAVTVWTIVVGLGLYVSETAAAFPF